MCIRCTQGSMASCLPGSGVATNMKSNYRTSSRTRRARTWKYRSCSMFWSVTRRAQGSPKSPYRTLSTIRNVGYPRSRSESEESESSPGRSRELICSLRCRVKIQILLHLLKLSLPGHCPPFTVHPVPTPSHAQKKRRVQQSSDDDEDITPRGILEDRLEGLMDRLVLWQMALPDSEIDADGTKPVRDWTQVFCEDVVQSA